MGKIGMDIVRNKGVGIDTKELSEVFGNPVVKTVPNKIFWQKDLLPI
jgi:Fe2+ transport system protein B